MANLRAKLQELQGVLLPKVARGAFTTMRYTRKVVGVLPWLAFLGLVVEIVCWAWSLVLPTLILLVAAMAFNEARTSAKETRGLVDMMKKWGFYDGPNG